MGFLNGPVPRSAPRVDSVAADLPPRTEPEPFRDWSVFWPWKRGKGLDSTIRIQHLTQCEIDDSGGTDFIFSKLQKFP
jgi:hypothetical protein